MVCNNEVITNVINIKYLGLKLNNYLSGETIVDEVTKKLNARLQRNWMHDFKEIRCMTTEKLYARLQRN